MAIPSNISKIPSTIKIMLMVLEIPKLEELSAAEEFDEIGFKAESELVFVFDATLVLAFSLSLEVDSTEVLLLLVLAELRFERFISMPEARTKLVFANSKTAKKISRNLENFLIFIKTSMICIICKIKLKFHFV